MAWLEIDINELNQETESFGKGQGLPEAGVYEAVIQECYLDKTQSGAVYFSLELSAGEFPNDTEISIIGWDVGRMVKNKDGQTKSSSGRYFTGLILLNKMAKCIGKDVSQLTPTKKLVKVFDKDKEVYSLNDLVGKKMAFGIRHKKYWNQDGDEKIKLDLVDICCADDKECTEKLKARIEKRPVVEDKGNKPSSGSNNEKKELEIDI